MQQLLRNSSGAYIPLTALISVGLLAIIGFVVDSGTLERTQMQLQKAADAGVMAGLDYRIQEGPQVTPLSVVDRTSCFIRQNLIQMGYDVSSSSLTISPPVFDQNEPNAQDPNRLDETLTVTITYDTPLLLFPKVPLEMLGLNRIRETSMVSVVAKAIVPRSNVILVLDTSNSMACPSSNPDCSCADPNLGPNTCDLSPTPGTAKIFDLRRGVYDFLSRFREGRDRVALVSFDLVGRTLVSFDRTGDRKPDGFQLADFKLAMGENNQALGSEFTPGGLTNTSDALMTAFEEAKWVNLAGKEKVAIVFFADGSPTAKESCYANTKAGLPFPTMEEKEVGCPAVDINGKRYIDLELEWIYSDGTRVRGPSPLIAKSNLLALPKSKRTPKSFLQDTSGNPNTAIFAPCSALQSDSMQAVAQSLNNCLNDLSSYLPDSTINQNGEPTTSYKESFFHRTESIAAYLRRSGFSIYALGVGPESGVDPRSDIYENKTNDFNRKNGFLTTIANDLAMGQQIMMNPDGSFPAFPFTGFTGWEDRFNDNKKGYDRDGMYLGGTTTQNVSDMFRRVARKIQLRFVK